MSKNTVVFPDTFQLGTDWKDDPIKSITLFVERANRIARFIKRLSDDPNVDIVNIVYNIEITVAEVKKEEPVEVALDNSLNEDFWIKVASGTKYE